MNAKNEWTVISLEVDNYEGNRNQAVETEHPSLINVTNAVKSLNGGSKSSMSIVGSTNAVLAVGGGHGNYHVQVTLADDSVFLLCDLKKTSQQVNIVIGSVDAPLAANLIVDQQMAMIAIEYFFLHATLAPSLNWVSS